jgi:hypothetical protein
MIISSCSNSNNFDLLSKSKMKTPLFLKTFNSIQTALNELEIDEETYITLTKDPFYQILKICQN